MGKTGHNPQFHKRIFWDVDMDVLDYNKSYKFIIERVFERGDVEDIRQCRRYYGDEKVSEVLLKAKWLSKETVYLAAAIFDQDIKSFECYKQAQSNPQHWIY